MTSFVFDEARLERLEALAAANQNTLAILTDAVQATSAALARIAEALEKPDDGSLSEALRGVEARLGGVEDHLRGVRQQLATVVHSLTGGAPGGVPKIGP